MCKNNKLVQSFFRIELTLRYLLEGEVSENNDIHTKAKFYADFLRCFILGIILFRFYILHEK